MGNQFTTFVNCRLCISSELVDGRLVVSQDTGRILKSTGYIGGEIVDLDDRIIAPGFLELHTNGGGGVHFSNVNSGEELARLARWYVGRGVTGFWATVATVEREVYGEVLPGLKPREFEGGASLLGVHVEGPYLHSSKPGAHDARLFQTGSNPLSHAYAGMCDSSEIVKLATVAPDIDGAAEIIQQLTSKGIKVSIGHTNATYEQGLTGLAAGATSLTHTLNCMAPLHHRNPGVAGLITLPLAHGSQSPYYSLLCDGIHLHPSVATLLYRASPPRAILVSDSIELAGLPDGVYPGNNQIQQRQKKDGDRVVLEGTDTLVGSCITVDQCVRNFKSWSECGVAEAVATVTENIANMMGLQDRGKLEEGRRGDFVVLDDDCNVLETWVAGHKVWPEEPVDEY